MSLIEQSNKSLRVLGLPRRILVILALELGWINVLDVLNFLRHKYPMCECHASHVRALEMKLIRAHSIGKKTAGKIITTMIAKGII